MKIVDNVHARGRGVSTHQPRKKKNPERGFSAAEEVISITSVWVLTGAMMFF
jgi:hypothetical protein